MCKQEVSKGERKASWSSAASFGDLGSGTGSGESGEMEGGVRGDWEGVQGQSQNPTADVGKG